MMVSGSFSAEQDEEEIDDGHSVSDAGDQFDGKPALREVDDFFGGAVPGVDKQIITEPGIEVAVSENADRASDEDDRSD